MSFPVRPDFVAVELSPEELTLAESIQPLENAVVLTRATLELPGPTIIAVSRGFERLTGYATADAVGRSPRMLQGPLTDRATLDRLRAVCARGERFEGEAVNYRKDGTPYLLHWCIDPVHRADGTITHFMATQEDVTDQRDYARQWIRAEVARGSALSQTSEQLAAIAEAILVLERTKHSFRSSQLADLRRKLTAVAKPATGEKPANLSGDGAG
jgi:PAS domain S-box-containing protein